MSGTGLDQYGDSISKCDRVSAVGYSLSAGGLPHCGLMLNLSAASLAAFCLSLLLCVVFVSLLTVH